MSIEDPGGRGLGPVVVVATLLEKKEEKIIASAKLSLKKVKKITYGAGRGPQAQAEITAAVSTYAERPAMASELQNKTIKHK